MFEFHDSSIPEPLWREDQINYDEVVAITTSGDEFTYGELVGAVAGSIYRRFGKHPQAATEAWNRMMQTNAETGDFLKLVEDNATRLKHLNIRLKHLNMKMLMQTNAETGDFLKLVEDNATRLKHLNIRLKHLNMKMLMQLANSS